MSTTLIEVRVWGELVGAIAPDPRSGVYVFEYSRRWLRRGIELSPLQMPLERARIDPVFMFPTLPTETFAGLPALIADSLPDVFGNALIDAWMARRGIAAASITTLDRLAYMGKRGMGALEFKPALTATRSASTPLQLQSLVEAARQAVRGAIDEADAQVLAQLIQVGTSAGGARAKAVVAWNEDTGELRSGQFGAPEGFEHWLLKFDGINEYGDLGESQPYGRIELAYSKMAKAAGIEMTPCRLLEEGGRAHFMTRRFDRVAGQKHHVQSLCAMSHLDNKLRGTHAYEQLFLTAQQLDLGADAMDQLFRRMAFNVMASNLDDHTKNFAFILRQGEPWALAPAFDVTHAHNPTGDWTSQHQLSVNGKFAGIGKRDLTEVGRRFGVEGMAASLRQVADAVAHWGEFAAESGVDGATTRAIAKEHVRLA